MMRRAAILSVSYKRDHVSCDDWVDEMEVLNGERRREGRVRRGERDRYTFPFSSSAIFRVASLCGDHFLSIWTIKGVVVPPVPPGPSAVWAMETGEVRDWRLILVIRSVISA
jgi:hypothetical protein